MFVHCYLSYVSRDAKKSCIQGRSEHEVGRHSWPGVSPRLRQARWSLVVGRQQPTFLPLPVLSSEATVHSFLLLLCVLHISWGCHLLGLLSSSPIWNTMVKFFSWLTSTMSSLCEVGFDTLDPVSCNQPRSIPQTLATSYMKNSLRLPSAERLYWCGKHWRWC